MFLTSQEVSLISLIRTLPSREADRVLAWARQLGELSSGGPIEWSDSWDEQDMADATQSAVRRFEAGEQGDR